MRNLETSIRLSRSVEYMFWGLGGLIIALSFDRFLSLSPLFILRYLYLMPLLFFFAGAFDIPESAYPGRAWKGACRRLKCCALLCIALGPFWCWWHELPENIYFKINNLIFLLSGALALFNIAGLATAAGKQQGRTFLQYSGLITRLGVIYLCLGPICALFIADFADFVLLGNRHGHDIFSYVDRMSGWKLYLVETPVLLSLFLLLLLRHLKTPQPPEKDGETHKEPNKMEAAE